MKFELDQNELQQFKNWKEQLPIIEPDVFGVEYLFEFVFHPTGLGTVKKIRRIDGKELDLTNYDEWQVLVRFPQIPFWSILTPHNFI